MSEHSGTAPGRKSISPQSSHNTALSGALPAPHLLASYEYAYPGAAERLICLAEREAEHRRISETAIVQAGIAEAERESAEAKRGQIFALAIVILSIAGCIFLSIRGHDIAASALGLGALGSVVTTFILGRGLKNTEKAAEANEFPNAGKQEIALPPLKT